MATTFAPLKTLTSTGHTLTLYPDRLVIQRTDWLFKLFGKDEVVDLSDIREIRLYTSRYMTGHWLQLAIIARHAKPLGLSFPAHQEHEVREFKASVEELLSHRELLPVP